MSNNELQKILDNIPAKSYKDKVKQIEDILIKYVQFKKDDVEFQAYLTDIEKKIEENVANATNNPKNEE